MSVCLENRRENRASLAIRRQEVVIRKARVRLVYKLEYFHNFWQTLC